MAVALGVGEDAVAIEEQSLHGRASLWSHAARNSCDLPADPNVRIMSSTSAFIAVN